ncbi:MAG: zinc ribbon domain-containing protein [Muricomes sp.]
MKCQNCGTEFEGDVCPNCNTPASSQTESTTEDVKVENTSSATQPQDENAYAYQGTEPPAPKKKISKRLIFEIAGCILLLIFMFSAIGRVPKSKYNELEKKYNALVTSSSLQELEMKDLNQTKTEYEEYKKKMAPYEKLDAAEAEARKIAAEKVAADKKAAEEKAAADKKAAEEKAAADKKAAEEKAAADAAAAKAAEEARGYETGISYDQLARTPDDFTGQKVKFYGKVIQVMEDTSSVQIRLAVDDNYDTILLGEYSSSAVSSRVLKDDYITIYGTSVGTITYQSTMGGNITIPGVYIDKIDQ